MIPRRQIAIDPGFFQDALELGFGDGTEGVDRFERRFATEAGVRGAVATCTGRVALATMIEALPSRGDRAWAHVILPAYTLGDLGPFLAAGGVAARYADIEPVGFHLDPRCVEAGVDPETRAVIATHLFGVPMDVGAICRAAGAVPVIEDCAHAAGTPRRPAPSAGAFFSLETIKPLHAYGGGVIASDDLAFVDRCRGLIGGEPTPVSATAMKFLRNVVEHYAFQTPAYGVLLAAMERPEVGGALLRLYTAMKQAGLPVRQRFSALQAASGLRNLAGLRGRVERRRQILGRYRGELGARLAFQCGDPVAAGANGYFAVALADRDPRAIRRALRARGIDLGVGSEITDFAPGEARRDEFPVAWSVFRRAIQLPLYEQMTDGQVERVVRAVLAET